MLMSSGDNNRAQRGTGPQPASQTPSTLHRLTTIWQPVSGGTEDLATHNWGVGGCWRHAKPSRWAVGHQQWTVKKLLWVCSGSGSPRRERIYSFLPCYEPDSLSNCTAEGAAPPAAEGDILQTAVTVNGWQSQHVTKVFQGTQRGLMFLVDEVCILCALLYFQIPMCNMVQ